MEDKITLDTSIIINVIDKISEDIAMNSYRKHIFYSAYTEIENDEEKEIALKINGLFDVIHNDLLAIYNFYVEKKNYLKTLEFDEGEEGAVDIKVVKLLDEYDNNKAPKHILSTFVSKMEELNQFLFILYTKTDNKLVFKRLTKDSETILH